MIQSLLHCLAYHDGDMGSGPPVFDVAAGESVRMNCDLYSLLRCSEIPLVKVESLQIKQFKFKIYCGCVQEQTVGSNCDPPSL